MNELNIKTAAKITQNQSFEVYELNKILRKIGVEIKIVGDKEINIEYDIETVKRKQNRNAGAKPKTLDKPIKIVEIERKMNAGTSAADIAKSLGISRATLYRKINDARDAGLDSIM